MSGYKRDPYSFHNRSKGGIKPGLELTEFAPSPVRSIKPPKRTEPAEMRTIATILLRRNYDLYKTGPKGDEDYTFLQTMYHESAKREITQKEAKRVMALITWLRGRK